MVEERTRRFEAR